MSVFSAVPSGARADETPLCRYPLEQGVRRDLRNPYAVFENESATDRSWRPFLGETRERDTYIDWVKPSIHPGANLTDADFCGFTFGGALAPNGGTVFLSKAKLWRARFYYADLTGADLSGSELNGAVFGRCSGTSFDSPCEGEANLSGANFSGADLRAADLSATRPYETIFTGAKFNHLTKLPLQWGDTEEERRELAIRRYGMIDDDAALVDTIVAFNAAAKRSRESVVTPSDSNSIPEAGQSGPSPKGATGSLAQ